mgnify:CR=1 FL=1
MYVHEFYWLHIANLSRKCIYHRLLLFFHKGTIEDQFYHLNCQTQIYIVRQINDEQVHLMFRRKFLLSAFVLDSSKI